MAAVEWSDLEMYDANLANCSLQITVRNTGVFSPDACLAEKMDLGTGLFSAHSRKVKRSRTASVP